MNKTATKLRDLRKSRTLNQTQLSSLVGISQQHLSDIENGLTMPDVGVQARLAAILGVSIDDLFEEEGATR